MKNATEGLTPLQAKLARMADTSPRLINVLIGMGYGGVDEVEDEAREALAAALKEQGYDLETESVPPE